MHMAMSRKTAPPPLLRLSTPRLQLADGPFRLHPYNLYLHKDIYYLNYGTFRLQPYHLYQHNDIYHLNWCEQFPRPPPPPPIFTDCACFLIPPPPPIFLSEPVTLTPVYLHSAPKTRTTGVDQGPTGTSTSGSLGICVSTM